MLCEKCKKCCKKSCKKKSIFTDIRFIIILSLVIFVIGILGFYFFNEQNWPAAIYDTASIMSGVGAADEPHTVSGKIFGTFYTLFIGLGYIFLIGKSVV